MKKIIYTSIIIGALLFFNGCKNQSASKKSLTKEITFTKEGMLTLKEAGTNTVIKTIDIEIADDEYQTQTGLMYRHSMADNQAMLFIFEKEEPRSFYMKNTEFPLDIIYINSKKQIVNIIKNAKPYDKTSLSSKASVLYVLEINGGLSDIWGLKDGDVIEW